MNPADTTSFFLLSPIAVSAADARHSGDAVAASSKYAFTGEIRLRAEERHRFRVLGRDLGDFLGVPQRALQARVVELRRRHRARALAEARGDREARARRRAGRGGGVARESQVCAFAAVDGHERLLGLAEREDLVGERLGSVLWSRSCDPSACGVENVDLREACNRAAVADRVALRGLPLAVAERAAQQVGRLAARACRTTSRIPACSTDTRDRGAAS